VEIAVSEPRMVLRMPCYTITGAEYASKEEERASARVHGSREGIVCNYKVPSPAKCREEDREEERGRGGSR
jgi:hypothetical protein